MHLNAKKSDLNTPLVAAAAATGGASLNNEPPEIDDARSGKRGENKTKKPMGRRRYVVCFMCFLGLMLVYMMRVDLSIAILTMDPQYRWDHLPSDPKGFVLSSFYVGYIIGQIPGGIIATKFGGNLVFGIGVLATGVFTMLLPLATCGSLTCPEYTAGVPGLVGTNATCNPAGNNLMASYSLTNKTETDCYAACLGTCYAHGNTSDVCHTFPNGTSQACTANCTLDDYCQFFYFASPEGLAWDSPPASARDSTLDLAPEVNTCYLFHSCAADSSNSNNNNANTNNNSNSKSETAGIANNFRDASEAAGGGSTYTMQVESYLPAVYVLRILMGLFESVTYPSYYALLSKWTPASERSFMVGAASGGAYFGTAVAFPVCSVLVASTIPFIGRWPGVFYLFGIVTLFWAIAWFALVRKDPESDQFVSQDELHWIVSTRKDDSDAPHGSAEESDMAPVLREEDPDDDPVALHPNRGEPCVKRCMGSIWVRMLLCPASLSLYSVHFAANWLNYTLLSFLPTYFADHLHFDISESGGIEVIPYVLFWFFSTAGGLVMDMFIRASCMTRLTARKVSEVLATVAPSLLLIGMGFTTSIPLAIVMMSLAVGLVGFTSPGLNANVLDISPAYTGLVFSMSNTIATIPGIVSPTLTELILHPDGNAAEPATPSAWRTVFYLAGAINVAAIILYLIFAKAHPVPKLS